jgi:TolA-binding protein
VIEAHDDLVNQADFHALTGVVRELADAQKDLADAQKDLADAQRRTEERVEELTDAQKRTEGTLTDVVKTQQKMLIRLDRLDGHMLEDKVAKNLPAFLGREFRRCRVLDRAEFVEGLEPRLPEAELADLMRADVIAVAKRAEQLVHLVVEVSCTADADDLDRAVRRAAALASAGFTAIGIVACESISPQTLAAARTHGLRVLTNGWLLPEAA